ncbi:MAG: DUF3854 domain-containing protein [Chloroflexota bacterium]|nr:MAG: hypothetical protein DLM70_12655 [Chloroflexota bacterium]
MTEGADGDGCTWESLPLLAAQEELLVERVIAPEIARARGVFSAHDPAQLEALGFAPSQRLIPSLVIPVHDLDGNRVGVYARPRDPRNGDRGKPIKYEWPARHHLRLDVPRGIRAQVRDASIPLWVTEGPLKADAAVSRGLCCVALPGVWGFLGNEDIVADWKRIPLSSGKVPRRVYIAFDSDVMQKIEVHRALARLRQMLLNAGADVFIVHLAYLLPEDKHAEIGT